MASPAVPKRKGEVLGIYVRPDQAQQLRQLAADEERSVSQVARRALEVGLRTQRP